MFSTNEYLEACRGILLCRCKWPTQVLFCRRFTHLASRRGRVSKIPKEVSLSLSFQYLKQDSLWIFIKLLLISDQKRHLTTTCTPELCSRNYHQTFTNPHMMHFKGLIPTVFVLASAAMALASPCLLDSEREKVSPFNQPGHCGSDAWWDVQHSECVCKGSGAVWDARDNRCDCVNPDTEWVKEMSTCRCRSPMKELNEKGECVCRKDPIPHWYQGLGIWDDCPVSSPAPCQRRHACHREWWISSHRSAEKQSKLLTWNQETQSDSDMFDD